VEHDRSHACAPHRVGPLALRIPVAPQPAEVEVLVDAELGYLHSMTGLFEGEPYEIIELVDLVLNPILDEDAFRIDASKVRVVKADEWHSRHAPSPLSRRWRLIKWWYRCRRQHPR
jgi:hypothetical protein